MQYVFNEDKLIMSNIINRFRNCFVLDYKMIIVALNLKQYVKLNERTISISMAFHFSNSLAHISIVNIITLSIILCVIRIP